MFHMKQNKNQNISSIIASDLFHVKQSELLTQKTKEKFKIYEEILKKWQKSINLVSKNTLNEIWMRHFWDSIQLYPLIPATAHTLIDMGSGAGFPGLALAIMDDEAQNRSLRQQVPQAVPLSVHLIESDTRKGLFMKEVIRQLGLTNVVVHTCRIEKAPPLTADVITARALADAPQLLAWAAPFMTPQTHCLFLKGAGALDEIKGLETRYEITCFPSQTAPDSLILHVQNKGVSNGITSTNP